MRSVCKSMRAAISKLPVLHKLKKHKKNKATNTDLESPNQLLPKNRQRRDMRKIKTRSLPEPKQKACSDRIPSSPECDICAVKHENKPCVYSPAHGKIGNGFFCFECYQSWKDYQLHLDGLTYKLSEHDLLKPDPTGSIQV